MGQGRETEGQRGKYRIGAVARMTGISTHALRAWERRYDGVNPERTESGGRLYSDDGRRALPGDPAAARPRATRSAS